MPAFRIIPCLDVAAGRVVKGVRFRHLRDMGDPVELAARYRDEGADEIVFLDVSATLEARRALVGVIAGVAEVLDVPFAVGGGVRSVEDAGALLQAGADKVGVNTAAVADPTLLSRLAERFGSQCVVLAIDAKQRGGNGAGSGDRPPEASQSSRRVEKRASGVGQVADLAGWQVVTHAGRRDSGLDAVAWASEAVALGAGEILLTSVDRDGTGEGFDIGLIAAVRARVQVPLIASGGGETPEHFAAAWRAGADAGLAATIFHEARVGVVELKRSLEAHGVPVRVEE